MALIVLQERDQGCADGNHLARGNVHVVNGADRYIDRFFLADSGKGLLLDEVAVIVELLVGLCDDVLGIAVCGHVFDLVGHMAVDDLTVRGLDEAKRVDATEGCQRADKTDVRAFRRLDRAHTAEVGRVHVSHFHGCTVTGQTARAQSGQTTLVGHTCQRVILVHELRQLGGSEELLDGGVHRADVDQGLRGDGLRILSGHTLADHALHTAQTSAQLVLDQLADLTDTTVAEVVDIVDVHAQIHILTITLARELGVAGMQRDQILDGGDDVFARQAAIVDILLQAKLAVDLVTADAGQIVTLGVEVEGIQQIAASFRRRSVGRADLAVQIGQSLVLGLHGLLGERVHDQRVILEGVGDLVFGHADGHEEHDGGLLALTIHAHAEHITLVDLKLEPCATARNNLSAKNFLVGSTILATVEVHARRTHQLRHDHSLGTADDEGAVRGLQREIAHEHGLGFDFTGVAVLELSVHVQRSRVGVILLLALLYGVARFLEIRIGEGQAHGLSEVLDRRDLLEDLVKTRSVGHGVGAVLQILLDTLLPALVADEPVKAVSLYTQQVGYINGLADGAEVHTVRRLVQINIVLVGACDDGGGVRRSLSQWTFLIAR